MRNKLIFVAAILVLFFSFIATNFNITGKAVGESRIRGDINNDGVLSVADYNEFVSNVLFYGYQFDYADMNGDNVVTEGDLEILAWMLRNSRMHNDYADKVSNTKIITPSCVDECNEYELACEGIGYRRCGRTFDADNCLELSKEIFRCNFGQLCLVVEEGSDLCY